MYESDFESLRNECDGLRLRLAVRDADKCTQEEECTPLVNELDKLRQNMIRKDKEGEEARIA